MLKGIQKSLLGIESILKGSYYGKDFTSFKC